MRPRWQAMPARCHSRVAPCGVQCLCPFVRPRTEPFFPLCRLGNRRRDPSCPAQAADGCRCGVPGPCCQQQYLASSLEISIFEGHEEALTNRSCQNRGVALKGQPHPSPPARGKCALILENRPMRERRSAGSASLARRKPPDGRLTRWRGAMPAPRRRSDPRRLRRHRCGKMAPKRTTIFQAGGHACKWPIVWRAKSRKEGARRMPRFGSGSV